MGQIAQPREDASRSDIQPALGNPGWLTFGPRQAVLVIVVLSATAGAIWHVNTAWTWESREFDRLARDHRLVDTEADDREKRAPRRVTASELHRRFREEQDDHRNRIRAVTIAISMLGLVLAVASCVRR